ncbi:set1/Ash2 histone methyltransferase complex subunit ASH2 [Hyalella azteca]|uniref:Set1/Ash2 histone methyltransferase complex subunit ASH2 n=1 Tax=Hyalella azteca TaxID=294128 RepID=A0A8B7NJB8_HYAAZ|nr:set1/Ash2 histone methyltransferase complex subunit ASH2 [Hyalella azteca]
MDSDSDEGDVSASALQDSGEKGGLSSCGYCGKLRTLGSTELMCQLCGSWFHESCISYQLGQLVPFMLNYSFTCKTCSPSGVEQFKKAQAQLREMCVTALANLSHGSSSKGKSNKDGSGTKLFSLQKDIIPFLEQNWEALTTQARRATHSWHTTLQKTLLKEVDTTFTVEETGKNGEPGPYHPFFGLQCSDLTLLRPTGDTAGDGCGKGGRGTKRKLVETSTSSKKVRGDMPTPKLHGYPIDHPFNKDGYRYILAEPDPHAPFRREFDDSSDWAGKPIPGWLYRCVSPNSVLLALHDRAPQLHTTDDRRAVVGEKGYSLIRATHGVSRGTWYFECTITDQPDGSHVRLGWAQQLANLQAPLGYDKFGYSWRSRKGTVFHESHGKHYGDGFSKDDVLGILIHIPPESNPVSMLPPTYKDKPLVKFRSHLYYEDKDDIAAAVKQLKPVKGSYIKFFKNGESPGMAFSDIHSGVYYPSLSLYKSISVSINFGPNFVHAPEGVEFRGMHEKAEEAMVEQTLADMTYLVENEGRLRLDMMS